MSPATSPSHRALLDDIPDAVTAGDTFEAAYSAAIEIAHIMLKERARAGQTVPLPLPTHKHRTHPDFAGMGWGMLEIDITPYLGKTEKVNVTLPGYVIQQIDRFVREHNIKRRSSFLADAAMEKLARQAQIQERNRANAERVWAGAR